MDRLTARDGRVLASLVEKQLTVPQYYPLTLNALVAACNQTSSRDPVTAYGEGEVLDAVESLKAKRLVRSVLPSHGRSVVRYRHVLDETLGLDASQLAVLAVLELRGPQTEGELRTRTERMATFDAVEHELALLSGREEPLAERVGRRAGQKEDRWISLLSEPGARGGAGEAGLSPAREPAPSGAGVLRADVEDLRHEVEVVRAELVELRGALDAIRSGLEELRTSLGG